MNNARLDNKRMFLCCSLYILFFSLSPITSYFLFDIWWILPLIGRQSSTWKTLSHGSSFLYICTTPLQKKRKKKIRRCRQRQELIGWARTQCIYCRKLCWQLCAVLLLLHIFASLYYTHRHIIQLLQYSFVPAIFSLWCYRQKYKYILMNCTHISPRKHNRISSSQKSLAICVV